MAKEVRERVPSAYTNYMEVEKNRPTVTVSDCRKVYNLTAQQYYGYDGKRYLLYDWFVHCLQWLNEYHLNLDHRKFKIAIPYRMGSDRAGGDWEVVCEILEGFLGHHEIIAYKLED